MQSARPPITLTLRRGISAQDSLPYYYLTAETARWQDENFLCKILPLCIGNIDPEHTLEDRDSYAEHDWFSRHVSAVEDVVGRLQHVTLADGVPTLLMASRLAGTLATWAASQMYIASQVNNSYLSYIGKKEINQPPPFPYERYEGGESQYPRMLADGVRANVEFTREYEYRAAVERMMTALTHLAHLTDLSALLRAPIPSSSRAKEVKDRSIQTFWNNCTKVELGSITVDPLDLEIILMERSDYTWAEMKGRLGRKAILGVLPSPSIQSLYPLYPGHQPLSHASQSASVVS